MRSDRSARNALPHGDDLTKYVLPPSSDRLFLGLDGGQSGTRVIVADASGQILSRGAAGPANYAGDAAGREKLIQAVTGAVRQALQEAGRTLETTRFAAACCGMSGGPEDKREILAELLPAGQLEVVSDAQIALWGAMGGEPGIIVIAGTGSIALGQNANGKTARAGGWGYVFGDECGAFGIVRQALRAALRQEEGWGPPTLVYKLLLDECGATSANELMHRFYTGEYARDEIAALAPLVGKAASEGDEPARRILAKAAQQLAGLASAVRGQLFQDEAAVSVAAVGGVFRNSSVAAEFAKILTSRAGSGPPSARVIKPKFEPVVGALLKAFRLAGIGNMRCIGAGKLP